MLCVQRTAPAHTHAPRKAKGSPVSVAARSTPARATAHSMPGAGHTPTGPDAHAPRE